MRLYSPTQRKFYHAVQEDLGWCRPFPKFLCIKGIVFMTFWQSMVLAFLANSTNMAGSKSNEDSDPEIWGKQAQNFLICLEMLLFSIAHFYCFPTEEWEDGYRPAIEKKMSAGDNLALGDFVSDLKLILRGSDSVLEKKKRKAKNPEMSDHEGTKKVEDDFDVLNTIVEDKEAEDYGDIDIEVGTLDDAEVESFPGSNDGSGLSDLSYASAGSLHEHDDTMHADSDLDISFVSFDAEHLSASLRSSLTQAFANTDEDVRNAASRLLPLMDKIGEEDEAENIEIIVPVQGDNDNYGSLSNTNNQESTEGATIGDNVDDFVEEGGDEAANETTSLLESSTKNTVQLRPSIFTSPKF